jgi:aryl-alcohol dehydrogenase-like predicted oxidoreductase
MRNGYLDAVQVIYNVFDQEPQAEFFPAAKEHNIGVIVRVALDESALAGKLTPQTKFAPDDFRSNYFAGDRLTRTIARVEKVRQSIGTTAEGDLPTVALRFALKPSAVSTVIPGIRNPDQAKRNCAVSDLPPLPDSIEHRLRAHNWRRGVWYSGK